MKRAGTLICRFVLALVRGARRAAQDLPSGPISLAGGRVTLGTDLSISSTPPGRHRRRVVQLHRLRAQRAAAAAARRDRRRANRRRAVGPHGGAKRKRRRVTALRAVCARPAMARRPIDIQAGPHPSDVRRVRARDYGAGNPLIGYPLAYQYLTAVRPDALPASTDDVLRMRARGWRPSYPDRLARHRDRAAADHRVPVGHRRAGARRTRNAERQRRADQRHGVRSANSRQQRRQTDHRDACSGSRMPRLPLGGSAAHGPYVADAALAAATTLSGDGALDAAGARRRCRIFARSLAGAR